MFTTVVPVAVIFEGPNGTGTQKTYQELTHPVGSNPLGWLGVAGEAVTTVVRLGVASVFWVWSVVESAMEMSDCSLGYCPTGAASLP